MPFEYLDIRREGAVEYVALNRPAVRNAFNAQMIAELGRWADGARADGTLRVAVVSGAGKTFSAGADVAWMADSLQYSKEENLRDAVAGARMFAALDSLPFPLVGRIHGAALGGGVGLAAVCDVVIAETLTVFGLTEVKLGILPAMIAPFVLAKIGRSAARELFLTGRRFSAARAREVGLVHEVVPEGGLDAAVADYVREFLTASPEAIAAAKALIAGLWNCSAEDSTLLTAEAIATRRVSAEGQEGLRAFLEKRTPSWSIGTGGR
jgi:methylglutaconyl-CoA hydratase